MTDADRPFIDAVLAAPDDDLPRLQFADRLAETYYLGPGREERAEFIRVQCALADNLRRGDYPGRPDPDCKNCDGGRRGYVDRQMRHLACVKCWDALRRRERELSNAHAWGSAPPLPTVVMLVPGDTVLPRLATALCRRGFPCELTLTAAEWLSHADAILQTCPIRCVWRDDERHPRGQWCGDGLVRLTTRPAVEERPGLDTAPDLYRLPGRRWWTRPELRAVFHPEPNFIAVAADLLLATEFPGVRFELPDAAPRPA